MGASDEVAVCCEVVADAMDGERGTNCGREVERIWEEEAAMSPAEKRRTARLDTRSEPPSDLLSVLRFCQVAELLGRIMYATELPLHEGCKAGGAYCPVL